ncbi:MAG TPA: hypothetical protein VM753_19970, partial [Anaeromyxobacter sp.]|nr:hypothetical protein [Anaeromyxobacter sp.]
MRALAIALRAAGWALLGALALAGLAVSALAGLAASSWGRPLVAGAAIHIVDRALAGQFELGGIAVLPNGGVDLRELRILDPDGHLVLEVDHARVFADVTGLGRGRIGVSVDLAGPAVMIEEEEGGGISLARAFAPANPGPPRPAAPREPE